MKNIPALTGLRFFAAMAIVLWHSQGFFFAGGAFSPFFLAGAVPLFFVLSGFVLAIGADKHRSWPDFFVARVARVWPAHIAALVFFFVVVYPYSLDFLHHPGAARRLILNVLLLQAWSPDAATYWSFNAPSWSVSCEMFFYAAFPICVAVLTRHTLLRLGALIASLLGCVMLTAYLFPRLDPTWIISVNPISGLAAFTIGIAAATLHKRSRMTFAPGTAVQVVALGAAIGANAIFNTYRIGGITPAGGDWIGEFGPSPFYAGLLIALTYDGAVSRILSVPIIVYGGEISYSIYLFHQLFIRWHSIHLQVFDGIPIRWQYSGIIAATLVTAAAVHHLIERPARRWIIAVFWKLLRSPAVVPHLALRPISPLRQTEQPLSRRPEILS